MNSGSKWLVSLEERETASALYHALPKGKAKRSFRIIEHSAIYILIAGTYTPLTLGVLHGAFGWTLFGVVWGFALAGITLKAIYKTSHPIISTALYLVMGVACCVTSEGRSNWKYLRFDGLGFVDL